VNVPEDICEFVLSVSVFILCTNDITRIHNDVVISGRVVLIFNFLNYWIYSEEFRYLGQHNFVPKFNYHLHCLI
jgi:hypothetical protein